MKQMMKAGALSIALCGAFAASAASAQVAGSPFHDLTTVFSTRGECQTALRWADYDVKHEVTKSLRQPAGPTNKALHATYECQKAGGQWHIVLIGG